MATSFYVPRERAATIVSQCRKLIEEDPTRPWSPKQLAEKCQIQLPGLYRAFEIYGPSVNGRPIGPMGFALYMRLSMVAAELRADDKVKVKEVATRYGFGDMGNFSRSFTERYGVGPKEYQRGVGVVDYDKGESDTVSLRRVIQKIAQDEPERIERIAVAAFEQAELVGKGGNEGRLLISDRLGEPIRSHTEVVIENRALARALLELVYEVIVIPTGRVDLYDACLARLPELEAKFASGISPELGTTRGAPSTNVSALPNLP